MGNKERIGGKMKEKVNRLVDAVERGVSPVGMRGFLRVDGHSRSVGTFVPVRISGVKRTRDGVGFLAMPIGGVGDPMEVNPLEWEESRVAVLERVEVQAKKAEAQRRLDSVNAPLSMARRKDAFAKLILEAPQTALKALKDEAVDMGLSPSVAKSLCPGDASGIRSLRGDAVLRLARVLVDAWFGVSAY